jgi:hypothetical protein
MLHYSAWLPGVGRTRFFRIHFSGLTPPATGASIFWSCGSNLPLWQNRRLRCSESSGKYFTKKALLPKSEAGLLCVVTRFFRYVLLHDRSRYTLLSHRHCVQCSCRKRSR